MADKLKKLGLSPYALDGQATVSVLKEAFSMLLSVSETVGILHCALSDIKTRGVKFVVGEANEPDAQSDREFDKALRILQLMRDQIPVQLASTIDTNAKNSIIPNHPGVETVQ